MTMKLFESMDEDSRRFYSRIFNTSMLNIHAVRRGYFDTLLCETDDPRIMLRWHEAVPQIIELIKKENARGLGGE